MLLLHMGPLLLHEVFSVFIFLSLWEIRSTLTGTKKSGSNHSQNWQKTFPSASQLGKG